MSSDTKNIDFILHIGNKRLAKGHFSYWFKLLKDIDYNFAVFVESEENYKEILNISNDVQVFVVNDKSKLYNFMENNKIKFVFHTANSSTNLKYMNYFHLSNIYIGSRNSDILSHIDNTYKIYDEIWVSSEWMLNKYKYFVSNYKGIRFKIIGKEDSLLDSNKSNKQELDLNVGYLTNTPMDIKPILILRDVLDKKININIKSNEIKNIFNEKSIRIVKKIDMRKMKYIFLDEKSLTHDVLYDLIRYEIPIIVYKRASLNSKELDFLTKNNIVYCFNNSSKLKRIIETLEIFDKTEKARKILKEYLFGVSYVKNKAFSTKIKEIIESNNFDYSEESNEKRYLYKKVCVKNFFLKNRDCKECENNLLIEKIKTHRISGYNFTHLIYTEKGDNVLTHLSLWLPSFIKSNVNFIVLNRNEKGFNTFKNNYKDIPNVFCESRDEVRFFISKLYNLKAIFYPSNVARNMHSLYFSHIKHIFIGHGDSDKSSSANNFFKFFDENWVAGQAHIDRFKNRGLELKGLQHIKVGIPILKELIKNSNRENKKLNNRLNFLYVPTWEGFSENHNYTSLYMFEDIISIFEELYMKENRKVKLYIKVHPKTGSLDSKLKDLSEKINNLVLDKIDIEIIDKNIHITKVLEYIDYIITDISGVLTECLSINRPIFLYLPNNKDIDIAKSNISYNDYTYVFSSTDELKYKIDKVLKNNDYLSEKRKKALQYIIGEQETLNEYFIKKLKSI